MKHKSEPAKDNSHASYACAVIWKCSVNDIEWKIDRLAPHRERPCGSNVVVVRVADLRHSCPSDLARQWELHHHAVAVLYHRVRVAPSKRRGGPIERAAVDAQAKRHLPLRAEYSGATMQF